MLVPGLRAVAALLPLALAACDDAASPSTFLPVNGGDPENGRRLIYAYGCGTCHTIDGIAGARGMVGPSLGKYAQRNLLAGLFPNTPPMLVAWLIDPPAFVPQTGMPAMGITEPQARDMVAYLYTLGASGAQVYPPAPPLSLRGRVDPVLRSEYPIGETDSSDTTPRTRRIERGLSPLVDAPLPVQPQPNPGL